MLMKPLAILITSALVALSNAADVCADETAWTFHGALVGWGAGSQGSVHVAGQTASADRDLSDVLSAARLGGQIHLEGSRGDVGFVADLFYLDLQERFETRFADVDVGFREVMAEAGMTYRIWSGGGTDVALQAGAHYTRVQSTAELLGFELIDERHRWIDPCLGARSKHRLTERSALTLAATAGGHSGSRLFTGLAHVSYRVTDRVALVLGYALHSARYTQGRGRDRFEYDVRREGIFFATDYRF